jgi:hypothetical protein
VRAERGCDEPTERVQFEIVCPACRGKDPACQECGGHGSLQFHRCPHSFYGREHMDVIRSVSFLECGVMPSAGGWADQSATWVDAVGIVRSEIDDYRRRESEKR